MERTEDLDNLYFPLPRTVLLLPKDLYGMHEMSTANLYGLVDMGSNGIRYSITDLSPISARSLPTVFQDRLGVSLYDAQYETGVKGPIPQPTIDNVLSSLKRFKAICADFGVSETNIKILATEATRNADNSQDYIRQIQEATGGWKVDLLPKEAEGKIGALGVASSFDTVQGLVMDLGGGSTQITWMIAENGTIKTSPKGSFSFPYGAAALTRQLEELSNQKQTNKARQELRSTMIKQFEDALSQLDLDDSLRYQAQHHGLTLYLSGGGFRGWGYLLMSQHRVRPYPVPIINGLHVSVKDFKDVDTLQDLAAEELGADIFRISKRRASQVPAVAFLVTALVEAIPFISDVRFCQGGVREGFLFDTLPQEIRAMNPLSAATAKYAPDSNSSAHLASLLHSAIPGDNDLGRSIPTTCRATHLLCALADLMYVQSSASKESASVAALYVPITGVLASAHGISHGDRALLSLMLCQRWDGELAPPHGDLQSRLIALLTQQEAWWARYVGRVAKFIGEVYPAGLVRTRRIQFESKWCEGLGKKGNQQGIVLTVKIKSGEDILSSALIADNRDAIEELAKKKNRVGGKEYGYGVPIQVDVEREEVIE